ncbi:hypothetical protein [Glycomyces arizonensis]|uniref:hypothetical protein n=1 Tax=Glycomyces arizonensis TaxID=256035 RepID=UPI0012EB604D|nr:hypothetical protein [Glycomyces arizonensis]
MTGRNRPPLEPGRVLGHFVNVAGTVFVLRASAGGHRIGVRLHHDEGPEIAIVCLPLDPSARLIRWQGLLWSSNPPEWKQEVRDLAFTAIDAILGGRPGAAARP